MSIVKSSGMHDRDCQSPDVAQLVRYTFEVLQKVAQRIANLTDAQREVIVGLLLQMKDASERERREIVDAIVEVILPEDTIGGIAKKPLDSSSEHFQRMREYQKRIGMEVRKLRLAKKMTQRELAERAGLRQSHISRLERGDPIPTDATARKLAKALGVKPAELDPAEDGEK